MENRLQQDIARIVSDALKEDLGGKLDASLDITAKILDVNQEIIQIATATEQQTATSNELSQNIQRITETSKQLNQKAAEVRDSTGAIASRAVDITSRMK